MKDAFVIKCIDSHATLSFPICDNVVCVTISFSYNIDERSQYLLCDRYWGFFCFVGSLILYFDIV